MKGKRNPDAQHRNTPECVLQPIRCFMSIGLDPCDNEWSTVGARVRYRLPTRNGRELPWVDVCKAGEGVFVNAEWAHLLPWAEKAVEESSKKAGTPVLLWTPFDATTRWCSLLLDHCASFGLWRTRVPHPLKGVEGWKGDRPTCLWNLGGDPTKFDNVFHPYARCYPGGACTATILGIWAIPRIEGNATK